MVGLPYTQKRTHNLATVWPNQTEMIEFRRALWMKQRTFELFPVGWRYWRGRLRRRVLGHEHRLLGRRRRWRRRLLQDGATFRSLFAFTVFAPLLQRLLPPRFALQQLHLHKNMQLIPWWVTLYYSLRIGWRTTTKNVAKQLRNLLKTQHLCCFTCCTKEQNAIKLT